MEWLKKHKKAVLSSFKSVLFNFKEFVCIYISIVIVQLLFGVWALSAYTNYYANDSLFNDAYAYDVVVRGSNQNISNLANKMNYDINQGSDIVESFASFKSEIGIDLHKGQLESFKEKYLKDIILEVDYTVTPKYVYRSNIRDEIVVSSVILGAASFLVGILILSVMYSVRTNHYKYQYGLYMTFGADKRMLGGIALGELLAINTLTLIPSGIISYLLALAVYSASNVSIVISFSQILIYLLLSYLSVSIASCISLGGFFGKAPVDLITTADNSNFVSSPRRSFHLFGKNMPIRYESYSVWRFRKYIARLVLGAVLFSVVFVSGIYCANMIETENNVPAEEFTVDFRYYEKDPEYREMANREAAWLLPDLLEIENVDSVTFEQSKELSERMDHILLAPGTELMGANATVPSSEADGYSRATNKCRYVCMSLLAIENYESMFSIEYLEGYDAERLLEDDSMIIVSEALYGSKAFDFEVGDKVMVAEKKTVTGQMIPESDPLKFLRQQISNCTFEYKEYTVGAVMHGSSTDGSIILGMSPDEYRRITGISQVISELSVYAKPGLGLDEINKLHTDVKTLLSEYKAWTYEHTNNSVYAIVDNRINLSGIIYLMCILVLMISPVVWIFSQVMFYNKREQEFRTLTSIGATLKEIGGIHMVSGAIVFIVSFIVNFALSRLICFIIYRVFTNLLPRLGIMGINASFDSFVPIPVVLLCAAVSAICGCISSLIPFILYKNKLAREQKELSLQATDL